MSNIPFPLGIPNQVVAEFMRSDCYNNKRKYYPNAEGVKFMTGEEKNEIYTAMREVYNTDEVFKAWLLKKLKI